MLGRIISWGVLAIFGGWNLFAYHIKTNRMGRDAFLAKENLHWDHLFAHPHSLTYYIFFGLAGFGLSLGIYELLAFGIFKALQMIWKGDPGAVSVYFVASSG
jgi:hypothetical protein